MLETVAIERYEKLLLGKGRIALNGTPADKEHAAKAIFHYAITELLEWDEMDAENHMTQEIIENMKLDELFKYIKFPTDIDPEKDLDYIAHLAFPNHPYNVGKQIMRVYQRILHGEEERFPKKIFDGQAGKEKGAVLLHKFIHENLSVQSIEKLYEQFSDMPRMNDRFRKAKIYSAARKLYPTPLDYLHNSLEEGDRDEFLYSFWQYTSICKIAENELKKQAAEEALKKQGEFDVIDVDSIAQDIEEMVDRIEQQKYRNTDSKVKSQLGDTNNQVAKKTEDDQPEKSHLSNTAETQNQDKQKTADIVYDLDDEPFPYINQPQSPIEDTVEKKENRIFLAYYKKEKKVQFFIQRKNL